MIKQTRILLALLCSVLPAAGQFEILEDVMERLGGANIESKKGVTFDKGSLVWDGGIHLTSDTMEAFAEKAEYLVEREELVITGDVSIYKDGMVYKGQRAVYSTRTNSLDASEMRSSLEPMAPIWFTAQRMENEMKDINIIEADGVSMTTHDDQEPNFLLRAEKVTIYPEDRVVFRNLKAYVGDTPVFWLPYLAQPLDDEQGYTFTPGFRSNVGAFLLNQYGDTWGDHSLVKYKLDGYSARGVGVGLDIRSRRFKEKENFGKFQFYWINDASPQETNITRQDRSNVDDSRYRINLQHRIYLPGPEESNLYVDVDLNKLSDQFFYEDFFPWEFREDPRPDNIVNIVKRSDLAELSVLGRFRVNDFHATDSRLPEIALDMVKQPLFDTPVYYNSTTSFGVLKDHLAEQDQERLQDLVDQLNSLLEAEDSDDDGTVDEVLDKDGNVVDLDKIARAAGKKEKIDLDDADDLLSELRSQVAESKFNRFHTYHEISYPTTVAEHFVIAPKVGVGFTNYSSVGGPKPLNSSRALIGAGVDASFKFSKVFDDVQNKALGLDGLRHVVQPYLSWSFLRADYNGKEFRGIDRLVASTQPRPIDVANFTAVDSLNDWNLVRLGVYNRLQTKRNGNTYNWMQMNSYIDTYIDDPEFDRDLSNLYNDIDWSPVPWMRLTLGSQLPVGGGDQNFTEVNTRLTFMPTKNWEFTIGHRLLQDHPFFEDSDLIDFHSYYRINDNWGLSIYERYEIEDSTLELQQYSIHRDLSSWAAALGAVIRDHRGETEYGVIFSLTLKEFPSVRIPLDWDPSGAGGGARR